MNMTMGFCVLAACLAIGALVTAVLAQQGVRFWRARVESLEDSLAAVRREIELVASISVRTGRRVQRVEHDYSEVAERVDMVESRAPATTGNGALDQAIEWARRGGDSDKLAVQFGLSSSEAELVARLHGQKKSA